MNGNKARGRINLIFALMWIFVAWMNASGMAMREDDPLQYIGMSSTVCVLDMLFSRADFALWYVRTSSRSSGRIEDARMNRYAIMAAAGAALFMNLVSYELYTYGITLKLIVFMTGLSFLMLSSYILTAKARRTGPPQE